MTSSRIEPELPMTNPFLWPIVIMCAITAVGAWWAFGQPGVPLKDGEYGCDMQGPAPFGGPGATVEDGQVTGVWDFDMSQGEDYPVKYRDVDRRSPTELTLTATTLGNTEAFYICTLD